MPENAAPVKVARTAAWGAEIVRCANSSDERQRLAAELREQRALEYIPPFDDARIIAGQGTVGLELAETLPGVATVVVPVGGGGLISGVATAVKALCPDARVVGVEPELAADAQAVAAGGPNRALAGGRRDADDLRRRPDAGARRAHVRRHLGARGRDRDRVRGGRARRDAALALEAKLLVEPTGALTLAAVESRRGRAGRADRARASPAATSTRRSLPRVLRATAR